MTHFAWNAEKNAELIDPRGISFERVIYHIEREGLLDVIDHSNQSKYPNQKMFIVNVSNYAFLVPFIENDSDIFLKTVIPSRKATKQYLEVKKHD
jgi:uncharacterized DUF497 family protein